MCTDKGAEMKEERKGDARGGGRRGAARDHGYSARPARPAAAERRQVPGIRRGSGARPRCGSRGEEARAGRRRRCRRARIRRPRPGWGDGQRVRIPRWIRRTAPAGGEGEKREGESAQARQRQHRVRGMVSPFGLRACLLSTSALLMRAGGGSAPASACLLHPELAEGGASWAGSDAVDEASCVRVGSAAGRKSARRPGRDGHRPPDRHRRSHLLDGGQVHGLGHRELRLRLLQAAAPATAGAALHITASERGRGGDDTGRKNSGRRGRRGMPASTPTRAPAPAAVRRLSPAAGRPRRCGFPPRSTP